MVEAGNYADFKALVNVKRGTPTFFRVAYFSDDKNKTVLYWFGDYFPPVVCSLIVIPETFLEDFPDAVRLMEPLVVI